MFLLKTLSDHYRYSLFNVLYTLKNLIIIILITLFACTKDVKTFKKVEPLEPKGIYIINDTLTLKDFNKLVALKADLHIHTYYSDGQVSPQERVEEAIKEDYDVIAITDHIEAEYRYFLKTTHPGDHNQSYKEALNYANNKIIIIEGAEITKPMPPGHFNFLFINDANKLDNPNIDEVFQEGKRQKAFIIWNHPSWKPQAPNGPIWYDFQTKVLKDSLLHGMEIHGSKLHREVDNQLFKWCQEKNLAVFANSDLHRKSIEEFKEGENRPFTLIFSNDRTSEAIKNALLRKRTIAVFTNNFYSNNQNLIVYFFNSLIKTTKINKDLSLFDNIGNFPLTLSSLKDTTYIKTIEPHENMVLNKDKSPFKVDNFYFGPNKNVKFVLPK